jgi:hypothetical protein
MLEAAKAHFINQFSDVIPSNGMGGFSWPKNVDQITQKGKETSSLVADARTTYEYINYLENGYINGADNVIKASFNAIADMAGARGLSKIERGAIFMSEQSATGLAKNAVFGAYIGSNVLRQWIVQPHQIVRTFSYNPIGWANGKIEKYSIGYVANKMGTGADLGSDIAGFTKFLDGSGLLDAVDKQNLVRGTLLEAADTTNVAVRVAKALPTATRKIGFDLGEQANLIGHAAAVYERWNRLGRDLTKLDVRDAAYSEIRAISYDMNFAGDMPYNQTSLSMALQFMQVPHKALLQMTNRRIEPAIRARMAATDLLMWGGPTTLIATAIGSDILPDDPFWREAFQWGMESALLNKALSNIYGEKVGIDLSSLAPADMTGWGNIFASILTGGPAAMIANSPAGQLFLKEGGRTRNAIGYMSRFFKSFVDEDEDAPKFIEVMNEVLKISSGWNNGYKAKLLLDANKRLDQYGNAIDKDVNNVEAWAQAIGFGTSDTREMYRISQEMSKDVKKHKEETLKVYNDIKRYYASKLEVEASDPAFITKVTGRALKIFENDPVGQAIIAKQLEIDLQGKDASLIALFLKRSGIPSIGSLKDQVRNMPVSDEQKALMMQRIEDVENIRSTMNKE